ncbi:MAG TPA: lipoyl(octanoyl) transferase LipB [Bdellovibrionales bacterium]|nr:lipoyl(octanoyl) transferase LipB [Bdellovibrionales bacterium]
MRIDDWGLIDYKEALDRQLALVDAVQADPANETIVICRHPPVVTLGRSTKPEDVFGWKGQTYEIQRGGRATYHGPNQLVVYPILDLSSRGRDLHGYLRALENLVIEVLREFGLEGRREDGATGVWVGERKLASIGVGIKKWVTYHGLALNVLNDPRAFQGINPCGFDAQTMISLQELARRDVTIEHVTALLRPKLLAAFR